MPTAPYRGETTVTVSSRSWKTYKAVLTAKASADTHLELHPQSAGEIELDMISLFPQNTFKGRKNGLRPDLAQTLADIHLALSVSPVVVLLMETV